MLRHLTTVISTWENALKRWHFWRGEEGRLSAVLSLPSPRGARVLLKGNSRGKRFCFLQRTNLPLKPWKLSQETTQSSTALHKSIPKHITTELHWHEGCTPVPGVCSGAREGGDFFFFPLRNSVPVRIKQTLSFNCSFQRFLYIQSLKYT